MVLQYKYSCVKSNTTILSILITSFFENFIAGILIIFTPSQNSSNIHPSSLFSQHCSPFKNISSIICDAYIPLTVQPSNRVWWSYMRSHTLNKTCNSFCQQPPITKKYLYWWWATTCLLSLFMQWFCLAWACSEFVHAVTTTVGSYVQQISCVWKILFPCSHLQSYNISDPSSAVLLKP